MNTYQARFIKFVEIVEVDDWKVKIYTISKLELFTAEGTYRHAIDNLHSWLSMDNSFNSSNDKIAFLIIHQGTEGVFSILNWWVGKNMLNTHIFISEYDAPNEFRCISGDGLAPCIWEMEVINHERISWTNNVLKNTESPNYSQYLNDTFSGHV